MHGRCAVLIPSFVFRHCFCLSALSLVLLLGFQSISHNRPTLGESREMALLGSHLRWQPQVCAGLHLSLVQVAFKLPSLSQIEA